MSTSDEHRDSGPVPEPQEPFDAAAAGAQYSQPYTGGSPYAGYTPYPGQPDPGQTMFAPGGTPPVPPETPQPTFSQARWGSFDIGYSLSQAWKGYTASWVAWVSSMLLLAAVTILGTLAVFIPTLGTLTAFSQIESGAELPPPPAWMITLWVLTVIVLSVVAVIWTLNSARLAYRVHRGETITILDFFRVKGLGKPFLVYLIVGLIIGAGSVAFYLPGIIAAFLLIFALPAAFQLREVGVGQALGASWKAVISNFGLVLAMVLIAWGLSIAGGILIIGALITTPLTQLFYAHVFQSTIGGPLVRRA